LRVRHSVVASPAEINLLWPARQVSALPNGFDFPAAAPSPSPISHRLLFYGSLFYSPNADGIRWMCREVWPLVKGRRPHAQLDVVGLGHEALADLADAPGVTFHGFVEDLDAPIRQAAALVVPLRVAGGTRIKILEAWAKGLPVISTTIGAEGLAACDGESVLLGDTAEAFADRCVDILDDIGLRRRLALAGYEHGRSKFDWSVVNRAIDRVLAESLQQTG
jgi:glycosyltransferase involved in cell wall biosynthesis